MELLSVNVGKARPNPWKSLSATGIDWVKQFTHAAVPGAFLRVIQPGDIRVSDHVEIAHRPDHDVTVALAFRAMTLEPDLLPRLLVADALAAEGRELARRRTANR